MSSRRLVGIDLGIASAHTVGVLEGESTMSVVPIVKNAAAWTGTDHQAPVARHA